ncbi:MAG: Rha family transcriptional regulator, partial [Candidatus Lokiarchaeota archaeon]|nr:Rha family transcriptional regulator [Candidatus Lokiarchaeota archaeon]
SKQLREEYGIGAKDSLRDYFTASQITDIERLENQIGVLIDLGNDYQTIKIILTKKYLMTA